MKSKIVIICILAAVLIILASITPAIGSNIVKSDKKRDYSSPLFSIRTQQSIKTQSNEKINPNYVGKGKTINFFPVRNSNLNNLAERAYKLIKENPKIISIIMDKISLMPEITKYLESNSIDIDEFKNQISYVINHPEILKEKILELQSSQDNIPQPVGLSTSSALGCFIIVLIMAPILAIIGVIIATVTIITCLLPNCFESFMENLLDGFIQGLQQG